MARAEPEVVPVVEPLPEPVDPWSTTIGRRLAGVPAYEWTFDWHRVGPCPACGSVLAVPLCRPIYCRCATPLHASTRLILLRSVDE